MGKKCVKMNEQNEFKDMPPLSDEAHEYMEKDFRPYLIYKSVEGAGKAKRFIIGLLFQSFGPYRATGLRP